MRVRGLCSAALIALIAVASSAGEVRFSTRPTATRKDGKVTIAFTVSASSDVEIAILDTNGKVVRHLSAGVLGGKKPPPPPLKTGLAQKIEWDMRDDFGKPAKGGPFKVRVRAGMSVKFGRIFGTSPYSGVLSSGAPSDSVAVAPDGSIYTTGCCGGSIDFDPGPDECFSGIEDGAYLYKLKSDGYW